MTKTDAQLYAELLKLKSDRDKLYASVKDMTVSANKTESVVRELAQYKSWIEALEKEIASRTKSESVSNFIERKKQWETE